MPNYETKVTTRIVTQETSTYRMEADNMCEAEAEAISRAQADWKGMNPTSVVAQIVLLEADALVFAGRDEGPVEPDEETLETTEGTYVSWSSRNTNAVATKPTSACDEDCECECPDSEPEEPAEEPAAKYVPYSARKTVDPIDYEEDDWDEEDEDLDSQTKIDNLCDEERTVGTVFFSSDDDESDNEDKGEYVTYRQRFGTVDGYVPCSELVDLSVSAEPKVIKNDSGEYIPYSQLKVKTED